MNIPDIDLSVNSEYSNIDYDKVDHDPVEQQKLKLFMLAHKLRDNIFSVEEFEPYSILFKENGINEIGELEYARRTQEYQERIDPYGPVFIVKEKDSTRTRVLFREENLVYVLPPVYNKIGMVNNLGHDAVDIMTAFNNLASSQVDDRFDRKKSQYSKYLAMVFNAMSDDKQLESNKQESLKLAQKAVAESQGGPGSKLLKAAEVQDLPADMLEELSASKEVTVQKALESSVEEEEFL